MNTNLFHPLIAAWFEGKFGQPTAPQAQGWPEIAAGRNTLIAAPTGSGKTLSAFLVCIDRLFRQAVAGQLEEGVQVVYVSPLKALSNDIQRNLHLPLMEIREQCLAAGVDPPDIRVAVRTGDTTASERAKMMRKPPHILVTTPESLYLLVTSEKGRQRLATTRTVIVDEIHSLARDKRGSHLTLTLERLAALCPQPPVRIGLSATQRPMDRIANFMSGADTTAGASNESDPAEATPRQCSIVDTGHVRNLDIAIEAPASELEAVCSNAQWEETYERLVELVQSHHSTLIFVNTRRLAERISHSLSMLLGEEAVASHHGSLSKELRHNAEQKLKSGELKAIVATASLEMGIDIGYIDLVCQIGSPRAIAAFLQRVGRSGHSLNATPKGRLFPLSRDQLIECMALIRAVKKQRLDAIEIPEQPLDILAQQMIAAVAAEPMEEDTLYNLCRGAWPYRHLTRDIFNEVLTMISEGVAQKRGAFLHRDQINGNVRARRGARLAAITSGGAIPETAEYRVITGDDRTVVGSVDEDFAIDSSAGDIFLLGNTSWRINHVRGGEVNVTDAGGAPPTIPFWFGESPGRTIELSEEISQLRRDLTPKHPPQQLQAGSSDPTEDNNPLPPDRTAQLKWLDEECGAPEHAAMQAIRYVEAQYAAMGIVPTGDQIVYERFFDESGGMQLVIHSPLGSRINRAWGLALRKCFCRGFDFELQAAADENGVLLSTSPQHSFPIDQLFTMLRADNGRYLLEQAVLAAPVLQIRWRWNVTRALAVLRWQSGKKTPPHLQRFRSDDLLASCFPETVGCLENHHGDVEIPDHPLVRQTMTDALTEAMDIERWLTVLAEAESGARKLIDIETREPSPFSHELINANPYAFLDDAPLEERRTRAVSTRRGLSAESLTDLARLDPAAIAQVVEEAWPHVRDADELHDALQTLRLICDFELRDWAQWMSELVATGRATSVTLNGRKYWLAAESAPMVQTVYAGATLAPPVELPQNLMIEWERSKGWIELTRGRITCSGPVTAEHIATEIQLKPKQVFAALEALEAEGLTMRGRFSDTAQADRPASADPEIEWCERRLLSRIHRITLDGLRKKIQPVDPSVFMRFLQQRHRCGAGEPYHGPGGVREAISQLQGFEAPAGAWEKSLLDSRVTDYQPGWLDQLFMSGDLVWGRLQTPRRDEKSGPTTNAMNRMAPLSVLLRDDLPHLLPPVRLSIEPEASEGGGPPSGDALQEHEAWLSQVLRPNARDVVDALRSRGALFFQELAAATDLLPTYLEEALRELAALGLVTSDGFGAVRAIVAPARQKRRTQGRSLARTTPAMGRWSQFPGAVAASDRRAQVQRWCQVLLARYGVVFRDLLTRESASPPWYELVREFRRMELRGEARGGRFITGVGGEQFGSDNSVSQLRKIRDTEPSGEWTIICAADPLNLAGILDNNARVTANHKNMLVLRDGRFVAAQQAGNVEFREEIDDITRQLMGRALRAGKKPLGQDRYAQRWENASKARAANRAATHKQEPQQVTQTAALQAAPTTESPETTPGSPPKTTPGSNAPESPVRTLF